MARYKKSKNDNKYEHSIKTYNPFRKRHARTGANQRRHKRKGVEYINKTVEAFTQKCYRDLKKELRDFIEHIKINVIKIIQQEKRKYIVYQMKKILRI